MASAIEQAREAAQGEPAVMGLLEQVLRSAVEVGIREGAGLVAGTIGELAFLDRQERGEVGPLVDEIVGRMLRGPQGEVAQ